MWWVVLLFLVPLIVGLYLLRTVPEKSETAGMWVVLFVVGVPLAVACAMLVPLAVGL